MLTLTVGVLRRDSIASMWVGGRVWIRQRTSHHWACGTSPVAAVETRERVYDCLWRRDEETENLTGK